MSEGATISTNDADCSIIRAMSQRSSRMSRDGYYYSLELQSENIRSF